MPSMKFGHKFLSSQLKFVNYFIHFIQTIPNIIKTKQLLLALPQIAQFDTSITLLC